MSVLTIDTNGLVWQGQGMARPLRIEYPGAIYHVMNRGDRREDIFKALRIVEEELKRRGWGGEEGLRRRRKGGKNKTRIAARLRQETTMTLKWIAERLAMGSWNNVSNLLATARK